MLRIKYEIDRLGLKQTEFAALADVNEAALSRIVNGKEPAYPKRGKRIADAVGWQGDPAELFKPLEVS